MKLPNEITDYYNTKRIKAKLKMSPVQYRTHFYQAA
ncbi:IS3 family transposase [Bacillus cereus]